jgi:molecular chaperone DnaK (HSP70)
VSGAGPASPGRPRYAVGIDLGTTNSALAEVDLAVEPAGPGEPLPGPLPLEVPQLRAPNEVSGALLLPSCIYLPSPHEAAPGAFALPWDADRSYVVGRYARERGAQVPGRLVSSAKSWLSHPGVDQRSALLPPLLPGAPADAELVCLSPLEAQGRVLLHLREAWEAAHAWEEAEGGGPMRLCEQAVTLTVPASFDPQARELTVQAAALAGLPRVTLLEEPQAALYAWVQGAGDGWRRQVQPGDRILVVDVGGGTSDFSLIAVGEEDGNLALERLAVGEHILLGGDNVDLALSYRVAEKLRAQGTRLDAWQQQVLTFACRRAKEEPQLFVDGVAPLAIPGRGSGMLAGLVRAELSRAELEETQLLFFPEVEAAAQVQGARRSGLTALGLPYAQDPAVTRHLASFLRRFPESAPTAILFNGGVFKDEALQERVALLVGAWTGKAQKRLASQSLDLAVALGASYAGQARAGRGIRIRGGTAHAYYVGVEAAAPAVPGFAPKVAAVCLVPFGLEEGSTVELPALEVGAVVGEKTRFRFFASEVRRDDQPGAVVDDPEWSEELRELPAVEALLPAGEKAGGAVLPVGLRAHVTEVGTLELQLVSREQPPRTFKLEFSVREGAGAAR